jgi:Flp pilus assembly protein TadG
MRLFDIVRNHHRRRSRGQSLVEFAMILPIMLVFLAGAIDLGRVFYATITLNNSAREGAFQAAQTPDSFDEGQPCNRATNLVTCRVQLESKDSGVTIAPSDISLTCSPGSCAAAAGNTVEVEVTGEFTLITPLLSMVFGGQTIPMSASAIAQIEYLPDPNTATLPPGPVAQIVVSANDLEVEFDGSGSSGDPDAYVWDFGDGASGSGPNVLHTYATAGAYTVTLTVINLAGEDSDTRTIADVLVPDSDPDTGADAVQLLSARRHRQVAGLRSRGHPERRVQRHRRERPDHRCQGQDPGPEPGSHPVPGRRDADHDQVPAELR